LKLKQKKHKTFFLFFSLSLFLIFNITQTVSCNSSWEDFPGEIADTLGISETAGGILLSLIFIGMWCFPLVFAHKQASVLSLILGLGCMCFTVAVGWLPLWVLLVVSLTTAGIYALVWRDILG